MKKEKTKAYSTKINERKNKKYDLLSLLYIGNLHRNPTNLDTNQYTKSHSVFHPGVIIHAKTGNFCESRATRDSGLVTGAPQAKFWQTRATTLSEAKLLLAIRATLLLCSSQNCISSVLDGSM